MSISKAFMKGFIIGAGLALAPVVGWVIYLERGYRKLDESWAQAGRPR